MNVSDPLQSFTTIFGWMQYQNLWEILTFTGIAFIPFFFIVANAFSENYTGQEAKAGSRKSLHMMEMDIAKAVLVIILAAQPIVDLSVDTLAVSDPCDTQLQPDETTYDDEFSEELTQARVPLWWYGTMAVSHGVTGAAIAGTGCPGDMIQTQLEMDSQRITDSSVTAQVQRFAQECFVPARSKYHAERPDVDGILEQHGADDPEWIGSRTYLQTDGYYNYYRADRPVEGFAFDQDRDGANYPDGDTDYGHPYCNEWWEGQGGPSLRDAILEEADQSFWESARDRLSGFFGTSSEELDDRMIRRVIDQTPMDAPVASSGLTESDTDPGIFSRLSASFGVATQEMFSHGPMMLTIREAAPIIQSFLLMGMYMLLPVLIVFSLYRWQPVFVATIAIFTVTFWSYLWHVSRWLEDHMMAALYPNEEAYMNAHVGSLISSDLGMTASLINIASGLLHLGLPVLFSAIVGWAGYNGVGGGVSAGDKLAGGAGDRAGRQGDSAGKGMMQSTRNTR